MFAVFNWTTQSESAAHCARTHNLNFPPTLAFEHENKPDSEKLMDCSLAVCTSKSFFLQSTFGLNIGFVGLSNNFCWLHQL